MTTSATSNSPLVFPQGFTWGAATSAYQIEGAPAADGKSDSIWDVFCREDGRIMDRTNGDQACEHFERYTEDVQLMKSLGLGAYRFSVAWTRVVPDGVGAINHAGLDFYDRLVDELLEAGITPYPTLYHWDLPQCLQVQGGWTNRDTAFAFADYSSAVIDRLGDRISTWTTLNEPFVSANHGYVTGEHAPGHTSLAEGFAASHHLMLAHGLAGERVRAAAPEARLAIVLNFTPIAPATNNEADVEAAHHQNNLENRWYIDPLAGRGYPEDTSTFYQWDQSEVVDGDPEIISAPIDLLGINYYTRSFVSADDSYELPEGTPCNTMGWEVHPPSLGWLLRDLHDRYDFPSLLITENGAPMPDEAREDGRVADDDRLAYIRDHLAEVHRAIADGCPVEGYLVWSLFDNFEWAWGYGPRFGIIEVDFATQERTPKKSAEWYAEVINAHQMELD